MSTFRLIISSPDGNLFDDDVVQIILRGADGDLAVMKGHVPFVTSVKPGKCRIELADGSMKTGDIDSGILTVSDEAVTLLSTSFRF